MKIGRRELLYLGAGAAAAGCSFWLWPEGERPAAYPLMRDLRALEPLWQVEPQKLELATAEDARRLDELVASLERAVAGLEAQPELIGETRVAALGAAERQTLRELWWQVLEPIVAIDALKQRYRGWYGLDYIAHPVLHCRAFALGFGGLCAQVRGGLRLLDALTGRALAQTLFDEADPELGMPARTFSAVRARLGRARDLLFVPVGTEWYQIWIRRHLRADPRLPRFAERVDEVSRDALRALATPSPSGALNKLEVVRSELFAQWFPLQRGFAEWVGDTRLARADRRLVSDAQLRDLRRALEPGDVILERRNWYLSNVGLPGFWPHSAFHAGTQSEILARLGSDPEVRRTYGDLGAHLAQRHPAAWASLGERDAEGHERLILEAVSEGVVSASVEHSCAADYVAVLRPRRSPLARARAFERALSFWGRPYDFNFDFATDDAVVCSELVLKAYETSEPGSQGLDVPFVRVAGRQVVPPTELVRLFAAQRGLESRTFDFVYFLDGREKEKACVVADADALAATLRRPKWDIVQP